MGCRFSRANGCHSLTCCCCLEVEEACSWIAVVSLVWGCVATFVDFMGAYLPEQPCHGCLDHSLNAQLSVAAGSINAVQWLASVMLLIGAKLGNQWLLVPWLAWGVVSLAMQGVWLAFTLPLMPSVRATASLLQLGWGAHFLLVVKTQYTMLDLSFSLPEEVPLIVPPNTPVRKHKRRWRRLHPACQPPIRTLLGAALRLQRTLQYVKAKELESEEEEQEEEDDEVVEEKEWTEEDEEIHITVGSHVDIDARGDKETLATEEEEEQRDKRSEEKKDERKIHIKVDIHGETDTRRDKETIEGQEDEKQQEEGHEKEEEEEDEEIKYIIMRTSIQLEMKKRDGQKNGKHMKKDRQT